MIREILIIANKLDSMGLTKEADYLDSIVSDVENEIKKDDIDTGSDIIFAVGVILDFIKSKENSEDKKITTNYLESILEELI